MPTQLQVRDAEGIVHPGLRCLPGIRTEHQISVNRLKQISGYPFLPGKPGNKTQLKYKKF